MVILMPFRRKVERLMIPLVKKLRLRLNASLRSITRAGPCKLHSTASYPK